MNLFLLLLPYDCITLFLYLCVIKGNALHGGTFIVLRQNNMFETQDGVPRKHMPLAFGTRLVV